MLKKAVGIKGEIVIAGVLNKIEIWPKEKYAMQFVDVPATTTTAHLDPYSAPHKAVLDLYWLPRFKLACDVFEAKKHAQHNTKLLLLCAVGLTTLHIIGVL